MKWIGLTGGIACGKSAVTAHLRSKGLIVIDADELAHMALRPGESSYTQVVNFFGPGILNTDKTINRKNLGSIVFGDPDKLAFLEKAIHPWVQQQVQKKRKELTDAGI
ncbi:MAG: dephospho-CoA kinase, partial [Bdellovibrionaceae bacterium]|nr:dephospho-CoA kinase [Pseudobdellovibrionaceae bacterium]